MTAVNFNCMTQLDASFITIDRGKISLSCAMTSGFVQQGGDSASLVTAYAALRPRDGFSHPHQERMKDTYILVTTY